MQLDIAYWIFIYFPIDCQVSLVQNKCSHGACQHLETAQYRELCKPEHLSFLLLMSGSTDNFIIFLIWRGCQSCPTKEQDALKINSRQLNTQLDETHFQNGYASICSRLGRSSYEASATVYWGIRLHNKSAVRSNQIASFFCRNFRDSPYNCFGRPVLV